MSYPAHARALMVLGLPLIGGHLAQIAIGVTDTVMLGWYGASELAAATLGASYFFVLFIAGAGFAFAVMPMVAAASGDDDADVQIRRITRMGIWLSLIYVVLVLPLFWYSDVILRLLGQNEEVQTLASAYLRIAGWGVIPAIMVMVLKSYLAALERTQVLFWITVLAACINALVNYALIFGNWGAPELGVQGAAIASVATQVISLVGVVIYALIVFPEHALFKRFWRPDWEMFGNVFRLGLPIGITVLAEVGLFAGTGILMGWLGTIPLAAHGIALSLASITFMVHLGLSNAATVRAGNAYGRRDGLHLSRGGRTVLFMSFAFAVVASAVFVLAPVPLINLYLGADEPDREAIIAIGVGLMFMAALFQLVDGMQAIALGLLRGIQDTKVPMIFAAISYWGIGLSTSYVLGFVVGWEGIGVWLGLVVGLACASVLLSWRFFGVMVKTV